MKEKPENNTKIRRFALLMIVLSVVFSLLLLRASHRIKNLLDTAIYVGPNRAGEMNMLLAEQQIMTLLLLAVAIVTIIVAVRIYVSGKETEDSLKYEAEHDDLTGLWNRGAFDRIREDRRGTKAIMLVDIDFFKEVNDGYGHDVGDQVLKKLAWLLDHAFRSTDYPCRVGGDEFAVVLMNVSKEHLRGAITEKIARIQDGMRDTSDGLPSTTLSIGLALEEEGLTPAEVFKHADNALYHVKENGRDGLAFYEDLSENDVHGSVKVTPIDRDEGAR